MRGRIISATHMPTHRGDGWGWMVLFNLENGKTARCWVMEKFRNFRRWERFLDGGKYLLDGLQYKQSGLIDADSAISEVREREYV